LCPNRLEFLESMKEIIKLFLLSNDDASTFSDLLALRANLRENHSNSNSMITNFYSVFSD